MDCDSADMLDIFCREGSDTMLHVAKVDDALRLGQLWSDLLIVFLAIEAAVIMLFIYSHSMFLLLAFILL